MKFIISILLSFLTVFGILAAENEKPNIIFILADDLGYGDLSCYGAKKIQTPNLDQIAKEGILFTDGHSEASTCTLTRYGLLTGRYCFRTWLKYSALSINAPLLIDESQVTIPSHLKSAGYTTSIIGKWHLGYGREEGFEKNRPKHPAPAQWESRGKGPDWNGTLKPGHNEIGFDYSFTIPIVNSFPPYVYVENHHVVGLRKDSPIGGLIGQSRNGGKMTGGKGAKWRHEDLVMDLTKKMVEKLEEYAKQDKSFFIYYAPHQSHIPYLPHERFQGTSQVGKYGDFIHGLDWSFGEIDKTLKKLGLSENTLVIFSSDNGSNERNRKGHRANGVLRGGKGDLIEGGHRVPFIARWPKKIKAGSRSDEIVSLTDMLATFAAIVGKPLPEGAGPDSFDTYPAFLGKKLSDRPMIMTSGGMGALSLRQGKWKLIDGKGDCGYRRHRSKKGEPPMQLYNLEEDISEINNLYNKYPELVKSMKKKLEELRKLNH